MNTSAPFGNIVKSNCLSSELLKSFISTELASMSPKSINFEKLSFKLNNFTVDLLHLDVTELQLTYAGYLLNVNKLVFNALVDVSLNVLLRISRSTNCSSSELQQSFISTEFAMMPSKSIYFEKLSWFV